MSPPTEQLIRDYLNRLSVAARGQLGPDDRRALVNRTRDFIERKTGLAGPPTAVEVARLLSGLGDPAALVQQERHRLAAVRGEVAEPAAGRTRLARVLRRDQAKARSASWHWPVQQCSTDLQLSLLDGAEATQAAREDDAESTGAGPDGMASSGTASSGTATNGAGPDGLASSGVGLSGAASNGAGPDGMASRGTASSGAASSGAASSGAGPDGLASSGVGLNGTASSGIASSGAGLNGTASSGAGREDDAAASANGMTPLVPVQPEEPSWFLLTLGPRGSKSQETVPDARAAGPSKSRWPSLAASGAGPEHSGDSGPAPAGKAEPADAGTRQFADVGSDGAEDAGAAAPTGATPAWQLEMPTESVIARNARRAAAAIAAWYQRYPLEASAVVLLGIGGASYPPVWLLGAALALASRLWDYRDKWVGLALPVLATLIGMAVGVTNGGHVSLGEGVHEGWVYAVVISRIAAALGACFLAWRTLRGRRPPVVPPWNKPHKIG